MERYRWMVATALVVSLGLTAGCVADEVVYVDEQGNELAVDADGQPIVPGSGERAPSDGTFVPYVVEERIVPDKKPAAAADPAPAREPAPVVVRPAPSYSDAASDAPQPDPNWDDLPPAGVAKPPLEAAPAAPRAAAPTKAPAAKKAPAKKKIDSSSALDLPPAG